MTNPMKMVVQTPINAYYSLKHPGLITVIALGLFAASDVASIVTDVALLRFFRALQFDVLPDLARAAAIDISYSVIATVQLILYFTCAAAFLWWFYWAYSNLDVLRRGRTFSTAWVVGGFIVPVLNLIRPYHMMRETWYGSQPFPNPQSDEHASEPESSVPLRWWWLTFLVSAFLLQLGQGLLESVSDLTAFFTAGWLNLVGHCVQIASALTCIYVVRRINSFQQALRERKVEKWGNAPF